MTPDAARLAARRAFGAVEPMKERYRERRGVRWIEDLPTFVTAARVFGAVAVAASYVPARSAMRIDSAHALRAD